MKPRSKPDDAPSAPTLATLAPAPDFAPVELLRQAAELAADPVEDVGLAFAVCGALAVTGGGPLSAGCVLDVVEALLRDACGSLKSARNMTDGPRGVPALAWERMLAHECGYLTRGPLHVAVGLLEHLAQQLAAEGAEAREAA